SPLNEFRSLEGQMFTSEKIVTHKLDLRVHNTIIRDQFLWVQKESFLLYCAVNDGIMNLMDLALIQALTKKIVDHLLLLELNKSHFSGCR
ncbi:hypothetical protein MKW98_026471, partial [Papaver atlanticum]